ncbi:hypothetical protein QCA50_001518 [Cerrena zonata]|uniref:Chitin-binding type-3 domain-containing protein n=1 Tax=Cerrena zonata TaxID=2478898 RepID=A0AAW0GM92_9APHY
MAGMLLNDLTVIQIFVTNYLKLPSVTDQAKFFASSTPANNPNNEWSAISACSGSPPSSPSSPTTSAPPSGPTGDNCAGVAAWQSTSVYTGGQQATFSGHLWTAKWWTQGDTPGGSAGVWTDNGACSASSLKKVQNDKPSQQAAAVEKNSRFFSL